MHFRTKLAAVLASGALPRRYRLRGRVRVRAAEHRYRSGIGAALVSFSNLPNVIDFGSIAPGATATAAETIGYTCNDSNGCNLTVTPEAIAPTWSLYADNNAAQNDATPGSQMGLTVDGIPFLENPSCWPGASRPRGNRRHESEA
jgi:hypothetical protein